MKAIEILTPGWFTTVQDQGRFDFQHMGMPISGAIDQFSYAIANLLVANPVNTALLEITIVGPEFRVFQEMDMALTGADMEIAVNNVAMPQWESLRIKPGDKVTLGQASQGCRGYLAFGGGINVPSIMGSFSTYVAGKIGGFHGRILKKNDILEIKKKKLLINSRCLPVDHRPDLNVPKIIRAVPGPQDDYFEQDILFGARYQVTQKADRMGYRLSGHPVPILEGRPESIVSEPVMPGSIQIPPDQQPIILLNEQTVGGYAKIATIISTDLPVVAQSIPGDTIVFEKISLIDAHEINCKAKDKIQSICFSVSN